MPLQLSEDEIDDLLYYARTGDLQELIILSDELCKREHTTLSALFIAAKDTYSGNGPLHMAAANGHTETLTHLIKTLSHPSPQNPTQLSLLNAQNEAGNTALHWAALNGHLECVKALLDNGADPTLTNRAGHDAVYEAELNDRKEVVEWVLKEGGVGLEEGIGAAGESSGSAGGGEGDEDMVEEVGQDKDGGVDEGEERIREGIHRLGVSDDGMKEP